MLVANSFDLWQKDIFFSAAEEVQRSADIMESTFRTWQRGRKETSKTQFWDELSRELQMALGTAKWQLEEFERAVRLSYRRNDDELTMSRHRQFVSTIEEQISRVEEALRESFDVVGKQPLRWINLDKQECDDLALFLSGTGGISPKIDDVDVKNEADIADFQPNCTEKIQFNPNRNSDNSEKVSSDTDAGFVASLDSKTSPRTRDSSLSMLEIVVVDDKGSQGQGRLPSLDIESTPKEKGFKPSFWMSRRAGSPQSKAGTLVYSYLGRIHWINQFFGRVAGNQRQPSYIIMSFIRSPRFLLVFMLAVFLAVPFLFYPT